MAQRTCEVEGCERKHQAKGLCGSHYNQRHRTRKFVDVKCSTCGETARKRDDGPNSTRRFCSLLCRDVWRCDQPDDTMHQRRQRVCHLPADHPVMWVGKSTLLVYADCTMCAAPMCSPAHTPRRYCSTACRKQGRNHKGDTEHRPKISKKIRAAVYERDTWTCWLCGQPTLRTHVPSDPLSPSLDHITPRSLGGGDGIDNLALAHIGCNVARGNTDRVTWPAPVLWAA